MKSTDNLPADTKADLTVINNNLTPTSLGFPPSEDLT